MTELITILKKHGYEVNQGEDIINITQDPTSTVFGFFMSALGGLGGWYAASLEPDYDDMEADLGDNLFFDLISWSFQAGIALFVLYFLYTVLSKGIYQLNISKNHISLQLLRGNANWKWEEIKSFIIDHSMESLYVVHKSGVKKKMFEFYSKDKSAVEDLKIIKQILLGYCQSNNSTEEHLD